MSAKRKQVNTNESVLKCSKKSWKAVTAAEKYFIEGRYGKALPLLFKYEDCEARAMLFLAHMYFDGIGTIQDMKKGVSYLENLINFKDIRSGEEGVLAISLFYMGELYYKGIVKAKDDAIAERLWLRGAMFPKNPSTGFHFTGSVECQTALGMFYSSTKYLNLKKALHWHKIAYESGSLISEGALGVMYMHGIGVQENQELAYNRLTKAALLGNTYAKGCLAAYYYRRQMYERTISIGKELMEEEDVIELAKAQGCPLRHVKRGKALGYYYVALCCQYGYNMPKDNKYAKGLIKKAIELSPEIAYDTHGKAILGRA